MPERAQTDRNDPREAGFIVGQQVTVRKLNSAGAQIFAYSGVIAQLWSTGARLDATWTRDSMALDYTTFDQGDHFVEWFFTDRWYNIMEVRGAGESLKGWYCNISYPAAFERDLISYRDLALDLWVAPDGALTTLDEDEFASDDAIDATARMRALDALDHLRALVARRVVPFDALPEE
ncbi:MAG TPA: DUF402 domain-containing protein [Ktedonobacterales bacterium]|jgi:hypothetical protein|nr:DUF402 domain-containing protein [Ktedonobacterales bacterium]